MGRAEARITARELGDFGEGTNPYPEAMSSHVCPISKQGETLSRGMVRINSGLAWCLALAAYPYRKVHEDDRELSVPR